ncbi:hypothetical protein [Actinomadura madurae]|nr:hypothetical protein [Actinomadura madurae]
MGARYGGQGRLRPQSVAQVGMRSAYLDGESGVGPPPVVVSW